MPYILEIFLFNLSLFDEMDEEYEILNKKVNPRKYTSIDTDFS